MLGCMVLPCGTGLAAGLLGHRLGSWVLDRMVLLLGMGSNACLPGYTSRSMLLDWQKSSNACLLGCSLGRWVELPFGMALTAESSLTDFANMEFPCDLGRMLMLLLALQTG